MPPSASIALTAEEIRARCLPGARIAFVSGNFNVLHAGHMRLLRFAREAADIVVVGINPDGATAVNVPLALRVEAIRSVAFVHHVVELPAGPVPFIEQLKPDIVIKGREFEKLANEEEKAVARYGGRLLFTSGDTLFSTIDLIQSEFAGQERGSIVRPVEYLARNGIDPEALPGIIERFAGLRVLVIGDLIIDDYVNCDPLGMSQEDPTIVVAPIDTRRFVGGAGIVSAHARGLGGAVRFLTVAGKDQRATHARKTLEGFGVEATILPDETRPTTLKSRYRAGGKTLLRVNDLRQHAIDHDIQAKLFKRVKSWINDTDLILFSDFNYGCLPQPLVDDIIELARRKGVLMAADSQASSQLADISRFTKMGVVTPTEREARLALHDPESGLAVIASNLRAKAHSRNVIVTMGAEGLLVLGDRNGTERLDRLPAFNTSPKDVAGAGDSLFTCLSMALARGTDIWTAAYVASVAAAIQVSRVGNTPLTAREVQASLAERRR